MVYSDGDKVLFQLSDGLRLEGTIRILAKTDATSLVVVVTDTDVYVPPEIKILGKYGDKGRFLDDD